MAPANLKVQPYLQHHNPVLPSRCDPPKIHGVHIDILVTSLRPVQRINRIHPQLYIEALAQLNWLRQIDVKAQLPGPSKKPGAKVPNCPAVGFTSSSFPVPSAIPCKVLRLRMLLIAVIPAIDGSGTVCNPAK